MDTNKMAWLLFGLLLIIGVIGVVTLSPGLLVAFALGFIALIVIGYFQKLRK